MAITDHSFATEFLARSITSKSGIDGLNSTITSGGMPEEYKKEIAEFIKESIENNNGRVPHELAHEVALKIYAYSPIPIPVLKKALVSSNFFGLAGPKSTVKQVGNTEPYKAAIRREEQEIERFNKTIRRYSTPKVMEVEGQTVEMYGSSLDDFARAMVGSEVDAPIEIVSPKSNSISPMSPLEIGENDKQNIQPGDNFVSSAEELDAEFTNVTRDITEIIVHFSETYQNANLNKDDIGGKYNYIVKRDGSIQRDVSINAPGRHTPENGHDAVSVGVCLIGGLTAASGEEAIGPEVDASAITRSQYLSLYHIFDAFYRHHPGGQALGHSEINPDMRDPGFDVRDYVYAKFGKISLYEDPTTDPALTKEEILKRVQGNAGVPILSKDPELEKKYQ